MGLHMQGFLIVAGISAWVLLVLWLLNRRPYVEPEWLREENDR